jgi:hypothetical protein
VGSADAEGVANMVSVLVGAVGRSRREDGEREEEEEEAVLRKRGKIARVCTGSSLFSRCR